MEGVRITLSNSRDLRRQGLSRLAIRTRRVESRPGTGLTGLLAIMNDPPRTGSDARRRGPGGARQPNTHSLYSYSLHKVRSLSYLDKRSLKRWTQLPQGDNYLPLGARRELKATFSRKTWGVPGTPQLDLPLSGIPAAAKVTPTRNKVSA